MSQTGGTHYENAFEAWLKDNGFKYIPIDQHKRFTYSKGNIKSFDFVFSPPGDAAYMAEIKGRKFSGTTFASFGSLQNWTTADDIKGLEEWVKIFKNRYQGLFIFVYDLENVDVDSDGREIFEFEGKRYVFIAVGLEDYKAGATRRSEKWQTVHLSAECYKKCALNLTELVGRKVIL